jgi:hypothetical protein
MSDVTNIGGISKFVGADAEVFLNPEGEPVVASHENPLPVSFSNGFVLPPHNDVEIQYSNSAYPDKPTFMTFRLNGTAVFWLMFSYDESGNLTRIQPD